MLLSRSSAVSVSGSVVHVQPPPAAGADQPLSLHLSRAAAQMVREDNEQKAPLVSEEGPGEDSTPWILRSLRHPSLLPYMLGFLADVMRNMRRAVSGARTAADVEDVELRTRMQSIIGLFNQLQYACSDIVSRTQTSVEEALHLLEGLTAHSEQSTILSVVRGLASVDPDVCAVLRQCRQLDGVIAQLHSDFPALRRPSGLHMEFVKKATLALACAVGFLALFATAHFVISPARTAQAAVNALHLNMLDVALVMSTSVMGGAAVVTSADVALAYPNYRNLESITQIGQAVTVIEEAARALHDESTHLHRSLQRVGFLTTHGAVNDSMFDRLKVNLRRISVLLREIDEVASEPVSK